MSAPIDWEALGGDRYDNGLAFETDDGDGWVSWDDDTWVSWAEERMWFVQLTDGGRRDYFSTEADAYRFVVEMQRLGKFVAELRELAGT